MIIATIFSGALWAASTPASAEADPMTIFGIKMLADVSVSECPAFTDPVKWRKKFKTTAYPYGPPLSDICYRRGDRLKSGTNDPLVFETLEIQFPAGSEPANAYGVDALAIDGKVHAIKWFTRGLAAQPIALASLKEKFGEPASSTVEPKQNGYGAKYDSVRASWSLPQNVTVVFEGIGATVNQGSVAVMTETARARIADAQAKADTRTPM